MKDIIFRTLPMSEMRYATVGDWYIDVNGVVNIVVAKELYKEEQVLITVHELIEYIICAFTGVSQKAVDIFDLQHVHKQVEYDIGDLPNAPYGKAHAIASAVERILAASIGVNWSLHEEHLQEVLELHPTLSENSQDEEGVSENE